MNILQAVILAIVQGISEFIPISSSGHLVLIREWFGWSDDGGVLMDTLLHAGSLVAILLYFWRDWLAAVRGVFGCSSSGAEDEKKLPWLLLVATLPIVLAGPFLEPLMPFFRNGRAIGIIMILTAIWFLVSERYRRGKYEKIGWFVALMMGLIQVVAILPGASRSGLTIGAAVFLGIARPKAARFSFFMAAVAILGATIWESRHFLSEETLTVDPNCLITGFVVCFFVSLASIHFCMQLFKRISLVVFGAYLAVLGIVMVFMSY